MNPPLVLTGRLLALNWLQLSNFSTDGQSDVASCCQAPSEAKDQSFVTTRQLRFFFLSDERTGLSFLRGLWNLAAILIHEFIIQFLWWQLCCLLMIRPHWALSWPSESPPPPTTSKMSFRHNLFTIGVRTCVFYFTKSSWQEGAMVYLRKERVPCRPPLTLPAEHFPLWRHCSPVSTLSYWSERSVFSREERHCRGTSTKLRILIVGITQLCVLLLHQILGTVAVTPPPNLLSFHLASENVKN
jgi:hypothetical protein